MSKWWFQLCILSVLAATHFKFYLVWCMLGLPFVKTYAVKHMRVVKNSVHFFTSLKLPSVVDISSVILMPQITIHFRQKLSVSWFLYCLAQHNASFCIFEKLLVLCWQILDTFSDECSMFCVWEVILTLCDAGSSVWLYS